VPKEKLEQPSGEQHADKQLAEVQEDQEKAKKEKPHETKAELVPASSDLEVLAV
jgi:hypothetical protein